MVRRTAASLLLVALASSGCELVRERWFRTLEQVGIEKRDLLVSRVAGARDAQEEAQEQFESALEQFQSVVGYEGGDLERVYGELADELDRSRARAEAVHERLRKVNNVARALFREWEEELDQYENQTLRRQSEAELETTRRRYEELLAVMDRAAGSMDPVLERFEDQVLFLKHNLNARALGSLATTAESLGAEVRELVAEMEASIAEADRFVLEMRSE